MKKRIEHTFCDHCMEQIEQGDCAYSYNTKEYHSRCVNAAISGNICQSGTIYVAKSFNPYSPRPITVFGDISSKDQCVVSAQLGSIMKNLEDIQTYSDLISKIFSNISDIPKNVDSDHLGATIASVMDSMLPVVIEIPSKKHIKNGSAPTIMMDASICAWLLPDSNTAVNVYIFGKEYSSFANKNEYIKAEKFDSVEELIQGVYLLIINALKHDVCSTFIVQDVDVNNISVSDNGTSSQIDMSRPIHPGRADLTDRTGDLFNL